MPIREHRQGFHQEHQLYYQFVANGAMNGLTLLALTSSVLVIDQGPAHQRSEHREDSVPMTYRW